MPSVWIWGLQHLHKPPLLCVSDGLHAAPWGCVCFGQHKRRRVRSSAVLLSDMMDDQNLCYFNLYLRIYTCPGKKCSSFFLTIQIDMYSNNIYNMRITYITENMEMTGTKAGDLGINRMYSMISRLLHSI